MFTFLSELMEVFKSRELAGQQHTQAHVSDLPSFKKVRKLAKKSFLKIGWICWLKLASDFALWMKLVAQLSLFYFFFEQALFQK
jgi:hypothetical protein